MLRKSSITIITFCSVEATWVATTIIFCSTFNEGVLWGFVEELISIKIH